MEDCVGEFVPQISGQSKPNIFVHKKNRVGEILVDKYIMLYYIILYYIILYYIILFYFIMFYIILYYFIIFYITLYYLILYYIPTHLQIHANGTQ